MPPHPPTPRFAYIANDPLKKSDFIVFGCIYIPNFICVMIPTMGTSSVDSMLSLVNSSGAYLGNRMPLQHTDVTSLGYIPSGGIAAFDSEEPSYC